MPISSQENENHTVYFVHDDDSIDHWLLPIRLSDSPATLDDLAEACRLRVAQVSADAVFMAEWTHQGIRVTMLGTVTDLLAAWAVDLGEPAQPREMTFGVREFLRIRLDQMRCPGTPARIPTVHATPPQERGGDILEHFRIAHLPDHLREVSALFRRPAEHVVDACDLVTKVLDEARGDNMPGLRGEEHEEMIVKLRQAARLILEAKDCAVRERVRLAKLAG